MTEPDDQAEDEEEESKTPSQKPALKTLRKPTGIILVLRFDDTSSKQSGCTTSKNAEGTRELEA